LSDDTREDDQTPEAAAPVESLLDADEVALLTAEFEAVDGADIVNESLPERRGWRGIFGGRISGDTSYRDKDVTPIPEPLPGQIVKEIEPALAPFSYIRVLFDSDKDRHIYEVIEPPLTPADETAFAFVRNAFLRTLDVDLTELEQEGARDYLTSRFDAVVERHAIDLTPIARARLLYYLERDFLGFGAIDAMMRDGQLEDISCDGPGVPVFLFHRKYESIESNLVYPDDEALDGFVMQLVQRSGKHISVSEPLVDATLPEGSRLQASLSREVTTRGSTFTIRRFRTDPLTPTDLLTFETMSDEMIAYMWLAVEHGASGLICGGTASGKTTSLNALSIFIPAQKKIVSIEDTRELNLTHANWIPGITRAGASGTNAGGGRRAGEVDMFDLLKAALRQRPEYILLGEVRGPEAYVLFQAMATGHTVYSTLHADSVASAVHRLESRPIEVPRTLLASLEFVCIQAEARVAGRKVRKMREITEISGIDARTGELLTNTVFRWDSATAQFIYSGSSDLLGRIADEGAVSRAKLDDELERRRRLLVALRDKGVRDIGRFSRVVARYGIDPDETLRTHEEA